MELALLVIYGLFLFFIFLYSIVQFNLAWNYIRAKKKLLAAGTPTWKGALPKVTVQLPVYNELYVIERLIDTVAALDYPPELLEIQVLDDSTDESFELAAARIEELRSKGVNIKHIRRPERKGFKAGALAYGLERAEGEFLAIFDADFVPDPDFLRLTIPHFQDEKIGVVQTRWEHLNKDYSILTALQAFGLDAHFSVEQLGRNYGGHFINFNGTAGVWRKKCIEEAGGWSSDTLTEDLDLSYRAQLRGWKFLFLPNVGAPSELPAEMNSLKSQQYRWTKGAAECAVKNLPRVMKQGSIPLSTKLHAIFHLMNSFVFVCILATALLSIPLLLVKDELLEYGNLFRFASLFLLSFVILAFFYWISRSYEERHSLSGFFGFLLRFPLFLSVSMGLSLHNSIAVLEGYFGRKTPFIRTPKFALNQKQGSWSDKRYRTLKVSPLTAVELLLMVYFLGGIALGIYLKDYGLLPFHIMLSIGFGYVSLFSLRHSRA